jgi:3-dehydroquinate synthetase
LKKINVDRYLTFLSRDKKNIGNNIGCILAASPGMLTKQQLTEDNKFKKLIKAYLIWIESTN